MKSHNATSMRIMDKLLRKIALLHYCIPYEELGNIEQMYCNNNANEIIKLFEGGSTKGKRKNPVNSNPDPSYPTFTEGDR